MANLKDKPFYLNDGQVEFVNKTVSKMTLDEKIGQLLCPQLAQFDERLVSYLADTVKVGGVMIRPFDEKGLKENISALQAKCNIPLFVAANLENGGTGAVMEGTLFSNPLGCAATGDKLNGYRLGKIACSEAGAVGVNWAFAPIIDIDRNYHNPITNVRTFGSDADTVLAFAREYVKAADEEGVMPTIKHFPGDGVDERDQHLLVSVNSQTYEEWLNSDGKIYKAMIADGVPAVMAAHISAPQVAKAIDPDISLNEAALPASQSKTLLTKLLRGKLAFNGIVVTDSTLMVGYMQSMPRRRAVPYSIECGVDMILFNRSVEEDVRYLKEGVESGILSMQRLDEAVSRIIALKVSKGLFENMESKATPLAPELKAQWTEECADKAITLVKDNRNILPISPKKAKRIYLNVIENAVCNNSAFAKDIKNRFAKEGFKVTLRKRKYPFDPCNLSLEKITPTIDKAIKEAMADTDTFVKQYDMAVIVLNMQTASNATVVRVNWNVLFGMGNDLPWYSGEMPLLVISANNPYHLLDIPMAHAYINTYTANKPTLDKLFDKITGRSEFTGTSPIDPFCGKTDTKI